MSSTEMENILKKFNFFTQKFQKFLTVQNDDKEDCKNFVKSVYDYTKSQENEGKKKQKSALPELIVEDFDEEQIWQQIELQNSECWDHLVWEVANCMSTKNDLTFPVELARDSTDESSEAEEDNMPEDDEEVPLENQINEEARKRSVTKKKSRPSIVDDKFFKLKDMEKFLLNEEKKETKKVTPDSDEESIDLFEDIDDDESEDEDGKGVKYSDFFAGDEEQDESQEFYENHNGENDEEDFSEGGEAETEEMEPKADNKRAKKVTFANQDSDDDSDDDSNINEPTNELMNDAENKEGKSEFELRQQRLKKKIEQLEEKALMDAPWQLKGEVYAEKRPENSLLQEVVDVDITARPPPLITEQTTKTLEEVIKRRIKDKAWDDVVRKEKPVDDNLSFRKPLILDHNKSKESLAQIYEQEYLKQKQALSGEVEEEKEPESHKEVRDAMNSLFSKLDALCHYHYTPRAPQAEVKIVNNTPAISMEEVAPVATSDAALLAPEEVKKKRKGDLMSKEERTDTDKKRERRKKKKLQKLKGGVSKVTDNRNTKKGVEAEDKSLKTSKAFFQQLQDTSTSIVKSNKRNVKNKGQ